MNVIYTAQDLNIEPRKRNPKEATVEGKMKVHVGPRAIWLKVDGEVNETHRWVEVELSKVEFLEIVKAMVTEKVVNLPIAEFNRIQELLLQAHELLRITTEKLQESLLPISK